KAHDQLTRHGLHEDFAHARIPQQKGSSGSSLKTLSPVMYAAPVMIGTTSPLARSCQRKLDSKLLPMRLSCTQASPSPNLPSAARQASFALVPVPQGERSEALPGHSTKFRLCAPAFTAGPKSS